MIARLQAENNALRSTAHLESITHRLKEQVEKLEPSRPEEGRGNPLSRRLQRLASAAIDLPLDIKDDDLSINDLALLCTVLEDEKRRAVLLSFAGDSVTFPELSFCLRSLGEGKARYQPNQYYQQPQQPQHYPQSQHSQQPQYYQQPQYPQTPQLPQLPQLYQDSQPYRPYHPYQTQHVSYNSDNGEEGRKENNSVTKRKASQFDIDQVQGVWPPKPEHLPDILSPLFHYFMGKIDIEEISGSYKDKHRSKTVGFTASMRRSGINVKLNTIGVS
ncbi:hypothetical protein FPHYL_7552 [Fusarium phyllophilum]|uniref:Uncharacterized protein n=1 Tax=Fusarium phyllophilum TaxID=47803 RepID=A0A8H5JNC6_9HYPO|nr:hypothetical protein FPHYL_7552 [Fusarium phyllophilum]